MKVCTAVIGTVDGYKVERVYKKNGIYIYVKHPKGFYVASILVYLKK